MHSIMNRLITTLLLINLFIGLKTVTYAQTLPHGYPSSDRQKEALLNDWDYYLDEGEKGFLKSPPKDVPWEKVSIPHSLKFTSINKDDNPDDEYQLTFHRWIGWYKRDLKVNASNEQKVFLEFEGAHQVTKLWVNDQYVGEHSVGGYTPFHFDITEFVKLDGLSNEIVLSVDNRRNSNIPPEGDRYDYIKWSGLYRDAYLVVTNPLHITFPWEHTNAGVFISTPSVTAEDATINIKTNVLNETTNPKVCKVVNRVIDTEGEVVLKLESIKNISPKSDFTFTQTGGITENVHLWSIEQPYLYRVNTTIYDGDEVVDVLENPLGIRHIAFLDGRGFVLNGKNVELIGTNRHQAMLFIGDAVPNSLQWKDAWQFKQAGFNSVRLAHYPHDNAFIEACDELGILIFEEPPTWIGIGNAVWMDKLEDATRRMVRNHRNHPSIIMWGAGINHRGPVERLHYACKEEDPTRPTASNGAPWTGPRYSGVTDIYAPMDYQNMPITANELTYLCEHGGSDDAYRNQFEVSKSRQMPNMIGVALWTAHDYQTFKPKTLYTTRRPWTIYRVPNPSFYWYQAELTEQPMVHITDERISKDGKIVIFSNCQRIDLYNDEQLIESRFPNKDNNLLYIDHPSYTFNYEWTKGKLTAKGYINNQVAASHTRMIPEAPYELQVEIESDYRPFYANGSDMKLIQCYVLDKNGERVISATNKVIFKVEGDGELLEHPTIEANPKSPLYGVATAYVRSTTNAGSIKVLATSENLKSSDDMITTIPYQFDRLLAEAKPIYDLKKERIDLSSNMQQIKSGDVAAFEFGEHKASSVTSEFLQFGWTAWIGKDSLMESFKSTVFPTTTYSLKSEEGMDWYTGWGLSGNLPYLALDGLTVSPKSMLTLTLKGLPEGQYELVTYHHHSEKINRIPSSLNIEVSDNKSENRLAVKEIKLSSGPLFTLYPASANITLHANGKDDIEIHFTSTKDINVVLNGFELKELVEKSHQIESR